jgi:sugar-phosphatase
MTSSNRLPASALLLDLDGVLVGTWAIALPGALTALTQPHLRVAVATSFRHASALDRLDRAGLPIPEVLIGADDVEHGKPHPEPYLRAAHLLGIPIEECVGIDDSPGGVQAIVASGATAVSVSTNYPANRLVGAIVVLADLSQLRFAPGALSWTIA